MTKPTASLQRTDEEMIDDTINAEGLEKSTTETIEKNAKSGNNMNRNIAISIIVINVCLGISCLWLFRK